MKGTVIAILAVVVALVVGVAIGNQLGAKSAAQSAGKEGAAGELTAAQKKIITDQLALAIAARSDEIAKNILNDAIKKGIERDAFKVLTEKAGAARPSSDRRPPAEDEDPNKRYDVPLGKSYTKGPANAPITIYEFSEFQCPFCSRGFQTMKQIEEKYAGKVRFVFKAKLLPGHSKAPLAHNAALAAGEQGKFWEMHDKIFSNQQEMGRDKYIEWAKELGLNVAKFTADMDNDEKYKDFLAAEAQDADAVGVRGTPTYIINGIKIRGAQPLENFQKVIDEELAKTRG